MRLTSLATFTLLFSITSGRFQYDPPSAQHIRSANHKHIAKRSFLHDLKVTINELTRSRRSNKLPQSSSPHLQKRSPGGGKGDQCVLKPPLSGGESQTDDPGATPVVTVTLTNTRHVETATKTAETITTTRRTTTITTTVESTPTPTSDWKVRFSHVSAS